MRLCLAPLRSLSHGAARRLTQPSFCRDKPPTLKIGRKHKSHRQQPGQDKPWRASEKGRSEGKGKGKSRGKGWHSNMGNEESHMVREDTPPLTLTARSLEALAEYIKDGRAQHIVVMVRAHHDGEA